MTATAAAVGLPRIVAPLVILPLIVVVAIGLLWRVTRFSSEFGLEEIVVRNELRTYRFGWADVDGFVNHSISGGTDVLLWALAIQLTSDGEPIVCRSTMCWGKAKPVDLLDAIDGLAAAHGVFNECY